MSSQDILHSTASKRIIVSALNTEREHIINLYIFIRERLANDIKFDISEQALSKIQSDLQTLLSKLIDEVEELRRQIKEEEGRN
jgi:hypothetical protein